MCDLHKNTCVTRILTIFYWTISVCFIWHLMNVKLISIKKYTHTQNLMFECCSLDDISNSNERKKLSERSRTCYIHKWWLSSCMPSLVVIILLSSEVKISCQQSHCWPLCSSIPYIKYCLMISTGARFYVHQLIAAIQNVPLSHLYSTYIRILIFNW